MSRGQDRESSRQEASQPNESNCFLYLDRLLSSFDRGRPFSTLLMFLTVSPPLSILSIHPSVMVMRGKTNVSYSSSLSSFFLPGLACNRKTVDHHPLKQNSTRSEHRVFPHRGHGVTLVHRTRSGQNPKAKNKKQEASSIGMSRSLGLSRSLSIYFSLNKKIAGDLGESPKRLQIPAFLKGHGLAQQMAQAS